MTTQQVETMSDILRIVREDPEARQQLRALLLTEEILELPAKVARLTELVEQLTVQVQELTAAYKATDERLAQFIARQEAINARQEAFNQEMREFKANQEAFNARQEAVNARQEAFNQEMREFKANQEAFNARQEALNQEIRESIARLEADIQELLAFKARQEVFNQEMREFKANQEAFNARAEQRFESLETKVDHLLGDNLEARMERAIMPRLARRYGLHNTELLQSQFTLPNANFEQRLNAAITAAKITREQADILRQADFIVRARRDSDQAEVFCVVEISWTIDQHDIARVRTWADILAAAGADNVYPLVVGREIPEPRQGEAAAAQVELVNVQRR